MALFSRECKVEGEEKRLLELFPEIAFIEMSIPLPFEHYVKAYGSKITAGERWRGEWRYFAHLIDIAKTGKPSKEGLLDIINKAGYGKYFSVEADAVRAKYWESLDNDQAVKWAKVQGFQPRQGQIDSAKALRHNRLEAEYYAGGLPQI